MLFYLLILLHSSLLQANETEYIWWEGESPALTNFPKSTWLAPQPFEKELLSDENWLTFSGILPKKLPFATYKVVVPSSRTYHLWVRKFWMHGPFRWNFDGTPWKNLSPGHALADSVSMRKHVAANWVSLGKVELSEGEHDFTIELTRPANNKNISAAFDCFLLSPRPFQPRGKWRPGEQSGATSNGWFAFEPELDRFSDASAWDFRSLNETRAGISGRVKRTKEGNLTLGDGTPVRFWGINIPWEVLGQDADSIHYFARRLAKLGFNLVRVHTKIARSGVSSDISPEYIAKVHQLVAILQEEGIYTYLSIYFPSWVNAQKQLALDEYKTNSNKTPYTLLFWHEKMQRTYFNWMETLLSATNKHTNKSLAEDPSVAFFEILNEDSLFFWTTNQKVVPKPIWRELEQKFSDWLVDRHGTVEAAFSHWNLSPSKQDNLQEGHCALLEPWFLTNDGFSKSSKAKRERALDQTRFYLETQKGFYDEATAKLRELNYNGLVVAGNWRTADANRLFPLELLSYTAGDVIDHHGYFGPKIKGKVSGWSVRKGQHYRNKSLLHHPEDAPFLMQGWENRPWIISEIGWPSPNRFRADQSLLTAAGASIQGIDGVIFFNASTPFLTPISIKKFSQESPTLLNAFPAAALMYRRGDMAAGPVVAKGVIPRKDPVTHQEKLGPKELALLGRVEWGHDPVPTTEVSIKHPLKSATGELVWNKEVGIATVDTPRTQGATGFLAEASPISLHCLTISSDNKYGSVMVTALDDRPIMDSHRLLIQTVTRDHAHGFRRKNEVIEDMGGYPVNVRRIQMDLSLRFLGKGKFQVTPLNSNGMPAGDPLRTSGDGRILPLEFTLDETAFYHLVERI